MHKKVELMELFYDLVFVYAISQMTGLIHHLHEGSLPLGSVLLFILSLNILVNTWMLQTVFTNRYGQNTLFNHFFAFCNMGAVLYMANTFTTTVSLETFHLLALTVLVSSLNVGIQYGVQYYRTRDAVDRQVILPFLFITAFRVLGILPCFFLPMTIAWLLLALIIVISTLLPMLLTHRLTVVPIYFPHLLERLTLLVIVMFGEMIVAIAPYFTVDALGESGWGIVLLFVTVIALFITYTIEVDSMIDKGFGPTTGHALIYLHYPIFLGISLVTVSLGFLAEGELENPTFVTGFFFLGLSLFYLAILNLKLYHKRAYSLSLRFVSSLLVTLLLGFILSLCCQSALAIAGVVAVMTVLIASYYVSLMHRGTTDTLVELILGKKE